MAEAPATPAHKARLPAEPSLSGLDLLRVNRRIERESSPRASLSASDHEVLVREILDSGVGLRYARNR